MSEGLRLWLVALAIFAVCLGVSWLTGIDRHYVLLVPFVLALVAYVIWPRLRKRE